MTNIIIQPHHLTVLEYFDKMYYHLLLEGIHVIYVFRFNIEMINYCLKNNRNYEILDFKYGMYNPLSRYKFKLSIIKLFINYNIRLVVQYNDSIVYNGMITDVAKKLNITTMVLQWALLLPEDLHKYRKENIRYNKIKNMSYMSLCKNVCTEILHILYIPIYKLMQTYFNEMFSFGKGNSDVIAVINQYSKDLLIKEGIESKICVVGSFDFDDIQNIKYEKIHELKNKLCINDSEIIISYFSQPFAIDELKILSKWEYEKYILTMIYFISQYYKSRDINYKLIIKVHPRDNIDYNRFMEYFDNVIIVTGNCNNELIYISKFIIGHYSTTMRIPMILNKPVISINTFELQQLDIGAKSLGIKDIVHTWVDFGRVLQVLTNNNYSSLSNIDYSRIITDGKCYERIIKLIKELITN